MVIIGDVGRLWMFIATGAVMLALAVLYGLAYPKTKYAPGYSEAKFRQIRVGMGADEVRKLIGEPLKIVPIPVWGRQGSLTSWEYSIDDRGALMDLGWQLRRVNLTNNIVEERIEAFALVLPWR